ncbi:arsenite methyltransferase [Kineosporia sp. A_224]|uniref:arsenite methyltransferase n=1 Tax=Kineosporia sp. A_224 TaxID=1962180 RepID=UPI000B4AE905|nr:arsenite methyltransferase [Kineosporia sp. A_224]
MSATQVPQDADELRAAVRERYAAAARAASGQDGDGTGCCAPSCCGDADGTVGGAVGGGKDAITRDLYDDEAAQTSGAALAASLGCGNPTALADLRPGEDVLDLGSGGGLDVLLSARRVSPGGTAYGVDMTPEMLDLARRNQAEAGVENARFLLGTIEAVPLPDASVDVVISNCVINLAADKDAVLVEAARLLRPGGRFAVSDVVLLKPLPDAAKHLMQLWTGCIAGALRDTDYVARLTAAGFVGASVEVTRTYSRQDVLDLAATLPADLLPAGAEAKQLLDALDGAVASAFVRATRP